MIYRSLVALPLHVNLDGAAPAKNDCIYTDPTNKSQRSAGLKPLINFGSEKNGTDENKKFECICVCLELNSRLKFMHFLE